MKQSVQLEAVASRTKMVDERFRAVLAAEQPCLGVSPEEKHRLRERMHERMPGTEFADLHTTSALNRRYLIAMSDVDRVLLRLYAFAKYREATDRVAGLIREIRLLHTDETR
jgi:hypothetical protein